MSTPLFSIIVPVYNHGQYIGDCLRSALSQEFDDLEVVVVDNQSTDETWDEVQQIARQDNRVHAYQNATNIGPVRNWLRGVEYARGRYGKILWSDDLIQPDYLSKTLPWLERGAAFVWTGAHIFDESPSHILSTSFNEEQEGMLPSADYARRALLRRTGPPVPVSPGCAVFPMPTLRKCLKADLPNRFQSDFAMHAIGNDLLLFLLACLEAPEVAHVPEPLSLFRAHPESITMRTDTGRLRLLYRAASTHFLASPGNTLLSPRDIRRFHSLLELDRLRFRRLPLDINCWQDFYPPGADPTGLDRVFFLTRVPRAWMKALRYRPSVDL